MMTAIVLAGGTSRRMGTDKALLPIAGVPMIVRVLRRLVEIDDLIVVGPPERYADLVDGLARVVPDRWPGRGPVGGLGTGLRAARHPLGVLVGCDMPWIDAALLTAVASRVGDADAAVPIVAGRHQPFGAAYRQAALIPIVELLEEGDPSLAALLDRLAITAVAENDLRSIDPDLRSFVNLNTPEDVAAAVERYGV